MLVKDVMSEDVVTVPCDLPVSEVADLFRQRCISGAPVVDEDGTVLGVVSQTDLMFAHRSPPSGVSRFQVEPEPAEGAPEAGAAASSAESIMTPGAIAVDENTSVAAAAKAMLERHIHRMLVTRDGKLAGIVSTMDLLRVLAGEARPAARRPAAKNAPARRRDKAKKK